MTGKLDPAVPSQWHEYYKAADQRRRRAGWRRSDELRRPSKRRLRVDPGRVLAVVMGVAAVAVVLCLVVPT